MEKKEIHGVVFDMDGLMFDSERIVKYSWDVAGERMGYGKLGDNIFHTLGFNVDKRKRHFKDMLLSQTTFQESTSVHARGDVALEVNQVAAILLVACTEEVVKAHIINGCGRLEGRHVAAQFEVFFRRTQHRHDGVPADS